MNIERAMRKLKGCEAEIAVFEGSGLGEVMEFTSSKRVGYKALGFKYAEVPGHERALEFGLYKGKKIVVATRFHLYEDGSTDDMYYLNQILKRLGVKTVIATTAVGGINPEFEAGDIMLIKDHINLSGTNPFVGRLPVVFADMSNAHDKGLREMAKGIAEKLKIKMHEGVHLQTIGPSYETPAEVRFFRTIGADTVSMSLAYGAICAAHLGMRYVAFASITNKAVSEGSAPVTHEEVLRISHQTSEKLGKIITKLIEEI